MERNLRNQFSIGKALNSFNVDSVAQSNLPCSTIEGIWMRVFQIADTVTPTNNSHLTNLLVLQIPHIQTDSSKSVRIA